MLYFAYGSNMSLPRLLARISGVKQIGRASLYEHQFRFHKCGKDGSAKADALYTGHKRDCVHGVLYHLAETDKALLDQIEDAGVGYEAKPVDVITPEGNTIGAYTYVALHIDRSLYPFDWYHQHVLNGALSASLPTEYIEFLEGLSYCPDHDQERVRKELAIYHSLAG